MSLGSIVRRALSAFSRRRTMHTPTRTPTPRSPTRTASPKAKAANKAVKEVSKAAKKT